MSLVSGLDRIERRLDGGAWATYAGPIRFEEGDRLLEFRGTDVAGNVEPTRALRVRVDATPPTSAADVLDPVAGWATAASRIRLTGSDDRSGLDRVEYRWPHLGSAWATYAAPLTPSGEGRFTLERRAVDAAGNVESVQSQTVAVDAVAPRVAVAWDGPTLNVSGVTHVTSATRLALTAEDAASGVEALEHRVDGGPWTATGASVSFTGADGARVLEWRARDSAGNERRGAIDVYLDNHRPPAIVAHSPQRSTIAFGRIDAAAPDVAGGRTVLLGRVPVTALAGPDVSGNAWTRVLVDNAVRATAPGARVTWTWDALAEPPGEHVLTFEAADGLGNVGRVTVRVVSVPSALP